MSEFFSKAERLKDEFLSLLEDLSALAKEATTSQQRVTLGELLWRLGEAVGNEFNPLKEKLRTDGAEASNHRPGTVKIAGCVDDQVVTVTIPKNKMVLRKDADLEQLKEALGEETFDRFFSTKTSYSLKQSELEEGLSKLDPKSRTILLRCLDQTTGTIRVSFQK